MAIYPESGRMHRKAAELADLCRARGAGEEARRALGRARCNDAYWHGVFGGLYLRHLRGAIWANLAEAEGILRAGEGLGWEVAERSGDGPRALRVHSSAFAASLDLDRGGAVTELVQFQARRNLADVLTRRWQSYHRTGVGSDLHDPGNASDDADGSYGAEEHGGMPSIHDLEERLGFQELPPYDAHERALTAERVLARDLEYATYAAGDYDPVRSWERETPELAVQEEEGQVRIALSFRGRGRLRKEIVFEADGTVEIRYAWDAGAFPRDAWFAPELSMSWEPMLTWDPPPAEVRRYDIATVSKSESGAERSVQGLSITPCWPSALGAARLRLRLAGASDGGSAPE